MRNKMQRPNETQIMTMIERLTELKDKVRDRTFFGDSNKEAIEAQIDVLECRYSEDDIWENWGDNDHLRENAQYARDWLDGEDGDNVEVEGDEWLADMWLELVEEE
jgi:hypothetical protein